MKNKKGFTLIELLAVIVIIAMILLLGFINITKISDNKKEKLYNNLELIIESAGKDYLNKHISIKDTITNSNNVCIKISTLKSEKFLEDDLKDPRDDTNISGDDYVKASKDLAGVISYDYKAEINQAECNNTE